MQSNNYNTVDLFKFIGSLMIFMLHLDIFRDSATLRYPFELLARWAVPFFFVISSFLLFSKEDPSSHNIDKQTLIKYIKRIAILYAAWFIVNLPSTVYLELIRPGIGKVDTWISFIKGALLSMTFAGSWYLLSSIFSAFLLFLMSKKLPTQKCIFISILPFSLCLLTSAYGGLLPVDIFNFLRWFRFPLNIFGGVMYFAIGKYLFENKEQFFKQPSLLYIGLAIFFFILYIIEIRVTHIVGIYRVSDFAISLLPLSATLAIISIKSQLNIQHPKELRKISTIVYCAQGNILCAASAAKFIGISSFLLKGIIGIMIMIFSVGLILYFQKVQKYRFVNYLT